MIHKIAIVYLNWCQIKISFLFFIFTSYSHISHSRFLFPFPLSCLLSLADVLLYIPHKTFPSLSSFSHTHVSFSMGKFSLKNKRATESKCVNTSMCVPELICFLNFERYLDLFCSIFETNIIYNGEFIDFFKSVLQFRIWWKQTILKTPQLCSHNINPSQSLKANYQHQQISNISTRNSY